MFNKGKYAYQICIKQNKQNTLNVSIKNELNRRNFVNNDYFNKQIKMQDEF